MGKNDSIVDHYQKLQEKAKEAITHSQKARPVQIQVGSATCENAAGAEKIAQEFEKHIQLANRKDIHVRFVGCTGQCSLEPIVAVFIEGKPPVVYGAVTSETAYEIFKDHIMGGSPVEKYLIAPARNEPIKASYPPNFSFSEIYGHCAFYASQTRVTLHNSGVVDPRSIFEYIEKKGFSALARALETGDPDWVVKEVTAAKLRGRGGAGFPTGLKWTYAKQQDELVRYIICNADEGDPGAFMDRSLLESDPFSVVEGMILAGFAIQAHKGFFYIRSEYPYAIQRVEHAIEACRAQGLLGKNVLGSDFEFDLEIRLGAGAFVCGEETALIHSIEGERGQPRIRPPFPAERGLWGKPTVINNVETLANLPLVIRDGGEKFSKVGTEKSGGTKIFAISGKVVHTGLVEVPMGITVRQIVFDICGGIPNGKKMKAVQTGGPAGGCIPLSLIDTPIDYENLTKIGTMMGSGGMIVLDEDDCMVSMAKFFMTFSQDESCGKCSPCREGTLRMLEILERITNGEGTMQDLDRLERLSLLLQRASLCGLGRGAPNPVLSTLRYFRQEYEEHIKEKRCVAKKCKGLSS